MTGDSLINGQGGYRYPFRREIIERCSFLVERR